ncbi:hypothetical protein BB559_004239 [Furculomyces boomerangus]|uniref:PPPDE domain-containing protein n=1 Tax=Furculomyces boomerangus TaxID=61424 RepID=A0A2T9YFX4_9FUNG|nr:hypothetical protein BB559_004239 [Furculomyces boomerangus]
MENQTESFPVKVHVYDLSRGLAKQFSKAFTGVQIDGIWHTSVVVYDREYYFGQGIMSSIPGQTIHGQPVDVISMGDTSIPKEMFLDFIDEMRLYWTADKYHLFDNNCNTFTQKLTEMLTGKDIPGHILCKPMGRNFLPFIESMFGQTGRSIPSQQNYTQQFPSNQQITNKKSLDEEKAFSIDTQQKYARFLQTKTNIPVTILVVSSNDAAFKKTALQNIQKICGYAKLGLLLDINEQNLGDTKVLLCCTNNTEISDATRKEFGLDTDPGIIFMEFGKVVETLYSNSEKELKKQLVRTFSGLLSKTFADHIELLTKDYKNTFSSTINNISGYTNPDSFLKTALKVVEQTDKDKLIEILDSKLINSTVELSTREKEIECGVKIWKNVIESFGQTSEQQSLNILDQNTSEKSIIEFFKIEESIGNEFPKMQYLKLLVVYCYVSELLNTESGFQILIESDEFQNTIESLLNVKDWEYTDTSSIILGLKIVYSLASFTIKALQTKNGGIGNESFTKSRVVSVSWLLKLFGSNSKFMGDALNMIIHGFDEFSNGNNGDLLEETSVNKQKLLLITSSECLLVLLVLSKMMRDVFEEKRDILSKIIYLELNLDEDYDIGIDEDLVVETSSIMVQVFEKLGNSETNLLENDNLSYIVTVLFSSYNILLGMDSEDLMNLSNALGAPEHIETLSKKLCRENEEAKNMATKLKSLY